jgi:hypothetical protein
VPRCCTCLTMDPVAVQGAKGAGVTVERTVGSPLTPRGTPIGDGRPDALRDLGIRLAQPVDATRVCVEGQDILVTSKRAVDGRTGNQVGAQTKTEAARVRIVQKRSVALGRPRTITRTRHHAVATHTAVGSHQFSCAPRDAKNARHSTPLEKFPDAWFWAQHLRGAPRLPPTA